MVLMDKNPRPPGQSANAEYPELPFDKDWADLVRSTRKSKGWSQDDLAGFGQDGPGGLRGADGGDAAKDRRHSGSKTTRYKFR